MHRLPPVTILLLVALLAGAARAEDWPRWRGPRGDGRSLETNWTPRALANGARLLWRAQVGDGYSSVAVAAGRLFTLGHTGGGKDTVVCLDALSGERRWAFAYDCEDGGSHAGPRATPVLDGDLLYVVSRAGHLHALNHRDGKPAWTINLVAAHGAQPPKWAHSASVLVEGDHLLLNAGEAGMCLDKRTGRLVWSSPAGLPGYATPVVYDTGAGRAAVIFGRKHARGVRVADGRPLWALPWETSWDVNAADPVIHGGRALIASGYGKGAALLDLAATPPRPVWQNTNLRAQFGTPVLLDGFLYGCDGNTGKGAKLTCVAWADGAIQWQAATGFCALTVAGDRLIVVTENGDLLVAAAAPTAYRELGAAKNVLPKICWTQPVLSGGVVYVRNDKGELAAVDLRGAP